MSFCIITIVNLLNAGNKPPVAALVAQTMRRISFTAVSTVMMIQPRKPQMLFWPPPKCLPSDIIPHQGAACSQRGDLPLGCGVL